MSFSPRRHGAASRCHPYRSGTAMRCLRMPWAMPSAISSSRAVPPLLPSRRVGNHARTHPNAEQIAALLMDLVLHNPPLVDLAILFIGTGLPRSEALGLRWADIDWAKRRISICQVVIEHSGQCSL